MEVLDRTDMENIITWMPHGRAFVVLQPQQLRDIVLPRFFKQTKFMSFTRQLNLWGFKRITKGVDSGAYYHELFLRGHPRLAILMKRQKIKGTGIKLTPNPETEPDFYKISKRRPLPTVDASKEDKPLPPIRQGIQHRNFDTSTSSALEYEKMVRKLNNKTLQQQLDQKQIYPFSNASLYAGGQPVFSQGLDNGLNMGMNMNQNLLGSFFPQGALNGGLNPNLNNLNDNLSIQQLLLRQQLQSSNNTVGGLLAQGMSNTAIGSNINENLAIQQLLLRQQIQSNSLREVEVQNARIAAAQQLLSQLNGPTWGSNDNFQIQELKQRLLSAASSLESLNTMHNFNPDIHASQLPVSQYLPNLFGQQQLLQQSQHNLQRNGNFNVFLNALQNPSDMSSAQAHFQQVPGSFANAQGNGNLGNPKRGSL
jgi:hypothetical protein